LAPIANRMELLETGNDLGDVTNKKYLGRSAHRKTDGTEKKDEHSRSTGDGKRGMTVTEPISLANLELCHKEQQQSKKDAS
jgi:hypothetical protein